MTRKLKRVAWVFMILACGRLGVSMFVNRPSVAPLDAFPLLLTPYVFLVAAVALIREERLAFWAVGVSFVFCLVTCAADYFFYREFWNYLGLWIYFITRCQWVVALVFLFETFRRFRKPRQSPYPGTGGSLHRKKDGSRLQDCEAGGAKLRSCLRRSEMPVASDFRKMTFAILARRVCRP